MTNGDFPFGLQAGLTQTAKIGEAKTSIACSLWTKMCGTKTKSIYPVLNLLKYIDISNKKEKGLPEASFLEVLR